MDKTTLMKGVRFLEELRKIDPQMQMQTGCFILLIAINPDVTMKNIAARLGISQAAASRNLSVLSEWEAPGKPGHGLVDSRPDPYERRRKILSLTPKGQRVVRSLFEILSEQR